MRGQPRPMDPKVSIVIPTYNSERTLRECLDSIFSQRYPMSRVEVIVADAGSVDGTLGILRSRPRARVVPNPLKTGEAGKAVGVRHARAPIIGLVDSDNFLVGRDWLGKVMAPFRDPEVAGSEARRFAWRPGDSAINRYCALMGVNDPVCYYLGNYDRENVVTGHWTGLSLREEDRGGWIKAWITPEANPTVGANGFFIRKKDLMRVWKGDYLFDIDVVAELAAGGRNAYALVDAEIVHLYCRDLGDFLRKQTRRIKDYLYYRSAGVRRFPWRRVAIGGLVKFVLSTLLVLPLFMTSLRGYRKKRDPALFLHPLLCWITLLVYGVQRVLGAFSRDIASRKDWQK